MNCNTSLFFHKPNFNYLYVSSEVAKFAYNIELLRMVKTTNVCEERQKDLFTLEEWATK